MLLERADQQCSLALSVNVIVDDVPAEAILAADMAKREIPRNQVEAVGRSARDRHRVAGLQRNHQAIGIIVARVEPLGADTRG